MKKKVLAIVAVMSTSTAALARPPLAPKQEESSLTVETIKTRFVVAPDFKFTEIDNRFGSLAGAYAGWLSDETLFVGGGAYWLTNRSSDFELAYGGGSSSGMPIAVVPSVFPSAGSWAWAKGRWGWIAETCPCGFEARVGAARVARERPLSAGCRRGSSSPSHSSTPGLLSADRFGWASVPVTVSSGEPAFWAAVCEVRARH